MINVHPRTYNEALRLSRCIEVRKYAPSVTDEMIADMYNFISADPQNGIGLSGGVISYTNNQGVRTDAFTVNTTPGFDRLFLSAHTFNVVNTATSDDSSGCGGCASNNNNNNNNNNG